MVRSLWQAFQDINNLLNNNPEFWVKVQSVGVTMTTVGTYLTKIAQDHLTPQPMGAAAAGDGEIDEDEAIGQLVTFIEGQGVAIPMAAPESTRRERIIELLQIAIPLLAKVLLLK